jgi:AraC-like DNA-binding protein
MFILVSTLGFLIGLLLILFRDKPSNENIWLALFFISNAFFAVLTQAFFVRENRWILETFFPYFVTFNTSSAIFLYFYFLFKLNPSREVGFKDLIHLIIPILLFFNASPFIFLKDSIRESLLIRINQNPLKFSELPTLFFSYEIQMLIRPILSLVYVFVSGFLLWKTYNKYQFRYISKFETRFLIILFIASIFHYTTSFTSAIELQVKGNHILSQSEYSQIVILPRASFVLILVSILFFPQIIFQKFSQSTLSEAHFEKKNKLDITNVAVPQYDLEHISSVVNDYLNDKPYLRPGFSLFNFSEETKIPQHQLTYFLKVKYEQNFNDFKNLLRIQHAIELIESGVAKNHTLETISLTCGFRSRTNFIDSFKKVTGKTPSDYLKA